MILILIWYAVHKYTQNHSDIIMFKERTHNLTQKYDMKLWYTSMHLTCQQMKSQNMENDNQMKYSYTQSLDIPNTDTCLNTLKVLQQSPESFT